MAGSRVEVTEANLDRLLGSLRPATPRLAADDPVAPGSTLTAARAVELFEWMVTSRALDVAARRLKADGRGFYTISSAGHENDVLLGALLRPTDPCFLHYRSGALMVARSRHDPGSDVVVDTLRSFAAHRDDPASGGRHKVWGSRATWVVPQTSTIASHVPKATGTAIAVGRAGRGGLATTALAGEVGGDAVVCASFGDASLNHATAQAGITMARYARRQGGAVPVLFVCEDNGLGISVPTPRRWVAQSVSGLPNLTYVLAEGDLGRQWEAVEEAIARCRDSGAPVFLHLPTVRLWGHAGSDVEATYRDREAIVDAETRDPLVTTARWLVEIGAADPDGLAAIVAEVRDRVERERRAVTVAPLPDRAAVMRPLAGGDAAAVSRDAGRVDMPSGRRQIHAGTLPEEARAPLRRTLGAHLNAALRDELHRRDHLVVFGQDVAVKGGVYGVTAGLQDQAGQIRVFDTLLDETSILGAAQGFGLLGYLPVPEIQYLAYLHNALDQLRGEACSTAFFSDGQFATPMVVRVASFAYQRGFGGHFHNDNAIGALRDIPGLVVAAPARGDDAVRMLRGCLALADAGRQVVAFLEPIALYHQRDLHEPGDGGWLTGHPPLGSHLLPGEAAVYPAGHVDPATDVLDDERLPCAPIPHAAAATDLDDDADVLVVTYANGVPMTLRAARRLLADGIRVRTLDLRWLNPLPSAAVVAHAATVGRVLVADEARATGGGIADAVVASLAEADVVATIRSVRSADSYVPLGPAADHVLLDDGQIERAVRTLVG